MMKSPSARLGAYLLVSLATLCVAAGPSERTTVNSGTGLADRVTVALAPSLSEADALFLQQALRQGREESAAAKLAVARSTRSPVKAYAQIVAKEQSTIDELLAHLVDLKGVQRGDRSVGGAPSAPLLSDDEGPSFDRRYVNFVSTGQARAVALYADAAEHAEDPQVKHFALRVLPKVQERLALARRLNDIAVP